MTDWAWRGPERRAYTRRECSPASRPCSRETDVPATAPAAWQPEQATAPGGGSDAASTGGVHATTVAIPTATHNAFIS